MPPLPPRQLEWLAGGWTVVAELAASFLRVVVWQWSFKNVRKIDQGGVG
jgi:hypothetical protein